MDQTEVTFLDGMPSGRDGEVESQSDDTSGSSIFKTQCVPSPKQRQRNVSAKLVSSPARIETDSSSDSSLEPRALTLKAIFERFKKKKHKKTKKRKYKPKLRPRGRPKERRNSRRSQIDKKQIKEKGPGFPCLQTENGRKPLPWRKILTYEQAVARGFFHHIEKLKYEHHLKESLKQMDAGDDLEREDLDSRKYKYLDDDASISPIEDSLADDEVTHPDPEECDITLVDDGCFIISSEFPRKMMNNKKVERTGKRTEVPEKGMNMECCGGKDYTEKGTSWAGGQGTGCTGPNQEPPLKMLNHLSKSGESRDLAS